MKTKVCDICGGQGKIVFHPMWNSEAILATCPKCKGKKIIDIKDKRKYFE